MEHKFEADQLRTGRGSLLVLGWWSGGLSASSLSFLLSKVGLMATGWLRERTVKVTATTLPGESCSF